MFDISIVSNVVTSSSVWCGENAAKQNKNRTKTDLRKPPERFGGVTGIRQENFASAYLR